MEKVVSKKNSFFRFFIEKVVSHIANGLEIAAGQSFERCSSNERYKMALVLSIREVAWRRE